MTYRIFLKYLDVDVFLDGNFEGILNSNYHYCKYILFRTLFNRRLIIYFWLCILDTLLEWGCTQSKTINLLKNTLSVPMDNNMRLKNDRLGGWIMCSFGRLRVFDSLYLMLSSSETYYYFQFVNVPICSKRLTKSV